MNSVIIGAMLALSMGQQTDTTFAVGSSELLRVETMGGSITVGVWDRDEVRVQAEHSRRTYISIDRSRHSIRVESEARRGPANLVDFRITVPRTFALDLGAQYGDITIDGAEGAIEVETLQGDVSIIGGRGTIRVSATMGTILIDGAEGQIDIESSMADIRVVNSSGEIYAETAAGTIVLENVTPTAVDVGSTGGRVYYSGTFEPNGTYFFGAHGGSITIVVPDDASAVFNLATVHGSISSNLSGEVESFRAGGGTSSRSAAAARSSKPRHTGVAYASCEEGRRGRRLRPSAEEASGSGTTWPTSTSTTRTISISTSISTSTSISAPPSRRPPATIRRYFSSIRRIITNSFTQWL